MVRNKKIARAQTNENELSLRFRTDYAEAAFITSENVADFSSTLTLS